MNIVLYHGCHLKFLYLCNYLRPPGNSITMSTHFCPLTASMAELPVSPEYQILKKTVTQTYLNELYVIFFEVIYK